MFGCREWTNCAFFGLLGFQEKYRSRQQHMHIDAFCRPPLPRTHFTNGSDKIPDSKTNCEYQNEENSQPYDEIV